MDPVTFQIYVNLAVFAITKGAETYKHLRELFAAKGLTEEQINAIQIQANAESLLLMKESEEMGKSSS